MSESRVVWLGGAEKAPWWKFTMPKSRVTVLEEKLAALEKKLAAQNVVFEQNKDEFLWYRAITFASAVPETKITVASAIKAIMRHVGLEFAGGNGVSIRPVAKKKKRS